MLKKNFFIGCVANITRDGSQNVQILHNSAYSLGTQKSLMNGNLLGDDKLRLAYYEFKYYLLLVIKKD